MATVLESNLSRGPSRETSDRSFGFVFSGVFVVVACLPLLHSESPRWWAFGTAIAFAAVAIIRPHILHPLKKAWLVLGHLMHRVTGPLVMGAVFFLCITPISWIMWWCGKDVLSLSRRPDLSSYWIPREPQSSSEEAMRRQF